jgi:hypothetical protein
MERDFRVLEYRSYGYGELATAVSAEDQAGTMGVAIQGAIALGSAAMGADWAVRPADSFQVLTGSGFVLEAGGV